MERERVRSNCDQLEVKVGEHLAGEELLVLEEVALADNFQDDHKRHFGSSQPLTGLCIRQIRGRFLLAAALWRGQHGDHWSGGVDIEFPDDRFISGRHCALEFTPQGYTLTDLALETVLLFASPNQNLRTWGFHLFSRQLLREIGSGDANGAESEVHNDHLQFLRG